MNDSPYHLARALFNSGEMGNTLQNQLAAWHGRNFGASSAELIALGVSEEAGELAHVVLKHVQKIRGYDDPEKFREEAGDAVADTVIFCMQMATLLRLDFNSLVAETARKVMLREWKKHPTDADKHVTGTPAEVVS